MNRFLILRNRHSTMTDLPAGTMGSGEHPVRVDQGASAEEGGAEDEVERVG